jgi:type I restriction enzyme S subunit
LAKIPALLKRFRQAVLAAACSGRLTTDWRGENPTEGQSEAAREALMDADDGAEAKIRDTPDSWAWRSLDRVCLKITDGEHLTPSVTEQGVPLLSAKDVRDDRLDFSDTKFVTGEFAKKSRLRCNPEQGDILVVSRGATVGRTCRVKVANVFCLMGSVLLFKPDPRYILPQMIEFSFKSPSGLAALVSTSSSTAQQAIYIKDMRSFAIPVPPLPEQQEIVRRVESLFALADQIEARLVAAKRQVDALTPSLLARAFAGKLVPQDPGDEPAAKLLERIRKSQPTNPRKGYAPKNG